MAEHPHAALIRRGYQAFSEGDMDTLATLLTSDVTHHVPGTHHLSGHHKGLSAVLNYYGQLAAESNGTLKVELMNVFVDGRGHAMSVSRLSAERGGKKIDQMGGIVFTIVGDKVTDLDECQEDIGESDAFWG
jgi:ketosteroid isomerase-like protein